MKRTALAGLFISAVMLASPVFAAETIPAKDDLCAINLQKIENAMATSGQTSENTSDDIKAGYDKAKAEKAGGDDKACISTTTQLLQRIQDNNKGGDDGK